MTTKSVTLDLPPAVLERLQQAASTMHYNRQERFGYLQASIRRSSSGNVIASGGNVGLHEYLQTAARAEFDARLPAAPDRAFKGEL